MFLSLTLWTLLWYVIGNTSTLLVLSLSLLSTWNPPIEETKTADPPPRDSKRGTQAWNGLQIKIDNFQWWGKWYENQSIYNAFQVISDKYYFCYLESFSHLEEEKGCFHIDFKYLFPRLGKHNIGLPKIFCKNSLSWKVCRFLPPLDSQGLVQNMGWLLRWIPECRDHPIFGFKCKTFIQSKPLLYICRTQYNCFFHLLTVDSNKAVLSDAFPTWHTWDILFNKWHSQWTWT